MLPRSITENTLFYGDNLDILRQHIYTESIDLIYLDPPFNSSKNYNVLFKDEKGNDSESRELLVQTVQAKEYVKERLNYIRDMYEGGEPPL